MTMPTNAEPRVYIDWYDDGEWGDAIDDVTDLVLGSPGLTVEWGRDTARSTAPPMIGAAECELLNEDRTLSPENPATPRYQFIVPGRPVKIEIDHGTESDYDEDDDYDVNDPYDGIGTYPMMLGHTSTFTQHPEMGGPRRVDVRMLDLLSRLKRKEISYELLGPTRTDTAVDHVLTAVGWPEDKRELWVSDSVMQTWWIDERTAWDVIVELLATEGPGAVCYVDGDGVFHWENRNYRVTNPRSVNPQIALHDGTAASGLAYSHLVYDPRWEDVVNRVTITTKQRVLAGSESVIWQLGTSVTVATGETRVLWARPQDPFQLAVSPVITTDYTVSGGTATVTLEWTNGAVAKLSITGTSGTTTVSGLQLRGYVYAEVGTTVIEAAAATDEDVESKTLSISAWPELDMNQAQAIVDSYLARYGESRPIIEVTFQNIDGDAMDAILAVRISDRVTITNQHLGLVDFACYVEKIRHRMTTGGKHEVTLWCEPVHAIGSTGAPWDVAIWDTSLWGI